MCLVWKLSCWYHWSSWCRWVVEENWVPDYWGCCLLYCSTHPPWGQQNCPMDSPCMQRNSGGKPWALERHACLCRWIAICQFSNMAFFVLANVIIYMRGSAPSSLRRYFHWLSQKFSRVYTNRTIQSWQGWQYQCTWAESHVKQLTSLFDQVQPRFVLIFNLNSVTNSIGFVMMLDVYIYAATDACPLGEVAFFHTSRQERVSCVWSSSILHWWEGFQKL